MLTSHPLSQYSFSCFFFFPLNNCLKLTPPCMPTQKFGTVWLFATPWTIAGQTPQSMGFSRQEYWTGLTFPPPEDLQDPGIKLKIPRTQEPHLLCLLHWQAGSLSLSHPGSPLLSPPTPPFLLEDRGNKTYPSNWDGILRQESRQAVPYNHVSIYYMVTYLQGGIGGTMIQKTSKLHSTTVHWDNFIVKLGYGGRCSKQDLYS